LDPLNTYLMKQRSTLTNLSLAQIEGLRFLWACCVDEYMLEPEEGVEHGGAILAHTMGEVLLLGVRVERLIKVHQPLQRPLELLTRIPCYDT
jgi:hypothetical protein